MSILSGREGENTFYNFRRKKKERKTEGTALAHAGPSSPVLSVVHRLCSPSSVLPVRAPRHPSLLLSACSPPWFTSSRRSFLLPLCSSSFTRAAAAVVAPAVRASRCSSFVLLCRPSFVLSSVVRALHRPSSVVLSAVRCALRQPSLLLSACSPPWFRSSRGSSLPRAHIRSPVLLLLLLSSPWPLPSWHSVVRVSPPLLSVCGTCKVTYH